MMGCSYSVLRPSAEIMKAWRIITKIGKILSTSTNTISAHQMQHMNFESEWKIHTRRLRYCMILLNRRKYNSQAAPEVRNRHAALAIVLNGRNYISKTTAGVQNRHAAFAILLNGRKYNSQTAADMQNRHAAFAILLHRRKSNSKTAADARNRHAAFAILLHRPKTGFRKTPDF